MFIDVDAHSRSVTSVYWHLAFWVHLWSHNVWDLKPFCSRSVTTVLQILTSGVDLCWRFYRFWHLESICDNSSIDSDNWSPLVTTRFSSPLNHSFHVWQQFYRWSQLELIWDDSFVLRIEWIIQCQWLIHSLAFPLLHRPTWIHKITLIDKLTPELG